MLQGKLTKRQAVRAFRRTIPRQMKWATVRMLGDLAKKSRDVLRTTLPSYMTVRTKFTINSIRSRPAHFSKSANRFAARVGTVSRYLPVQALGGSRPKGKIAQAGAPTRAVRKTAKMKTTVSRWPSGLLKRGAAMQARRKERAAAAAAAGKTYRKRKRKSPPFFINKAGNNRLVYRERDGKLVTLYRMKPDFKIKPIWPMLDIVRWASHHTYRQYFRAHLLKALHKS